MTTNDVTFTVTNDGSTGYVEGAKVTFGGQVKKTNASGSAVFKAQNGDYTYTISASGYQTAHGSVTVDGAETKAVTLAKK